MSASPPGDTVVVTRLDRLARSTRDLLNLLDRLGKDNIGFKSLRETSVDTTSPQGRLVVNISEFDRELIHARMTEGRKRAVANGVKFGPKFAQRSSHPSTEPPARFLWGSTGRGRQLRVDQVANRPPTPSRMSTPGIARAQLRQPHKPPGGGHRKPHPRC